MNRYRSICMIKLILLSQYISSPIVIWGKFTDNRTYITECCIHLMQQLLNLIWYLPYNILVRLNLLSCYKIDHLFSDNSLCWGIVLYHVFKSDHPFISQFQNVQYIQIVAFLICLIQSNSIEIQAAGSTRIINHIKQLCGITLVINADKAGTLCSHEYLILICVNPCKEILSIVQHLTGMDGLSTPRMLLFVP